jgi:putative transcriptional regulator
MTIQHHPSDELLTAFAAGTLDQGQHVAIATHVVRCPHCRGWMHSMEHVGGKVLADLSPTAMSRDAFSRIEARLNEPVQAAKPAAMSVPAALDDIAGLPAFVRRYPAGPWKWIAPRVHLRPIGLPHANNTRVFLLKSGPGTKMLEHTHTGIEMTCVLSGSFSHEGGHFGPGDFDLGDETMDHQVLVDPGEDCICLVAMQGDLRLNGLIGRLVQPFVRM